MKEPTLKMMIQGFLFGSAIAFMLFGIAVTVAILKGVI